MTVVELIAMCVRFAKTYYNESSEWTNSKLAMRPLKGLYGKLSAAEFSPLKKPENEPVKRYYRISPDPINKGQWPLPEESSLVGIES